MTLGTLELLPLPVAWLGYFQLGLPRFLLLSFSDKYIFNLICFDHIKKISAVQW
jgi:hypothetical protein